MGLIFTLLYVTLSLLSPADMVPSLAPYRVLFVLFVITSAVSLVTYAVVPLAHRLSRQFWLVVAFVFWVALVLIPNRWLYGPIFVIQAFTPTVIVYFFAIAHLRSTSRLNVLRLVLAVASLYIVYMGLSQYPIAAATHTDMPYAMVYAGEEPGEGIGEPRLRGLGVLADPNIFGQFLLVQLPLLFVSNKPRGMRLGYLLAVPTALVFLAGMYLTGSRGALLGLLVLIALY